MSQWRGKVSTMKSFCFSKKQKEKTQNARQSYVLLMGKTFSPPNKFLRKIATSS